MTSNHLSQNHLPNSSFWQHVAKLLKLETLIFFSGFRKAKARKIIGFVALSILIIGLAVLFFLFSRWVISTLSNDEIKAMINIPLAFDSLPSIAFSAIFMMVMLSNFGVLLQGLYLAKDMDFLLTSPIPIRAVFFSKMLFSILPGFGLFCLFSLPLLYGLGAAAGYNIFYYILVFIALVVLTLVSAGISSVLVMLVVRILPAKRVAEVLSFIGIIITMILSQSSHLLSNVSASNEAIVSTFSRISFLNAPWSPIAWLGRSVVALGKGDLTGLLVFLPVVAGGLVLFWLALSASERLYYSGWASLQNSENRKIKPKSTQSMAGTATGKGVKLFSAPVRAIIIKDFKLIRRDLKNMSQLITPLIISLIWIFSATQKGNPLVELMNDGVFSNALAMVNLAIAMFCCWSITSNLGMASFAREGQQYWLLKAAPVSEKTLLLAKFMVCWIVGSALGIVISVFMAIVSKQFSSMSFIIIAILGSTAGLTGINLAMGVPATNLDWSDPRKMVKGGTGCLVMIIDLAFLAVMFALFAGPSFLMTLLKLPQWIGSLSGLVLGLTIATLCAVLPTLAVAKKVSQIGMTD